MKKIILFLFILAAPLFAFAQNGTPSINMGGDQQQKKFDQFYQYLNAMYVDTLNSEKLVEDAIKKVLAELDPHSSYSSAEEMKAIAESFEGSFSGIGVEFDVLNDTLMVVNTITGGPSEVVGVMPNDKIVEVDGESVIGITRAKVPKVLRGPKGTTVEIGVLRKNLNDPLHFRITRDNIPIYTVDAAYKTDNNIGYIKVNRFAETTMKEFTDAFKSFGKIDGLIVDLRGNGGGLRDQAIQMSEFFLPAGSLIVSTEGRSVKSSSHVSRRDGQYVKGPLAILIDSSSASASEIVAGAVQDWDRGIIVGQPTFGKGLVQRQIPLMDQSAVRITVARYHTPTGRVIQRPYEKGKTEDYYADHLKRATDQEYAQSANADAEVFYTLKSKRKVTGGGGIQPDVYVGLDTTKNYSYWNQLVRGGVINEFVNSYLEKERNALKDTYASFEQFDSSFEVDPGMFSSLVDLGKSREVEYSQETAESSINEIKVHIKALIAQKLWTSAEYYKVVNGSNDHVFAKATESVSNWKQSSKILQK